MQYDWDTSKRLANLAKHGVDFAWDTAIEAQDDRFDYGEDRWVALGYMGIRLHILIYTRRKKTIRIISLRRANKREKEHYEKAKTGQHKP